MGAIEFNKDKLLGKGAFGQVYQGQWNKRAVALKEIDIKLAQQKLGLTQEEVLETLQWEVARLSTANHPNLIQFYGLYVNEGKTFLVMEYCEGGDLKKALEKSPVWSKCLQWAIEITQGLAYLHHQGMLHRDLKAENILIDSHQRARLADLGVAQVDELLQKEEATVVFKGFQDRMFAAPEALKNAQASTAESDIYALGIVFWQLLTQGRKPDTPRDSNQAMDVNKLLERMQTGKRDVIPENCPPQFKELILACWAYEPSKRPKMDEILKRLNELSLNSHPEPLWMSLCQQMDVLIHPKRIEGLNYVPSLVTENRVLEDLDVYWQRIERLKKIEKEDTNIGKFSLVKSGNPPLELQTCLAEFLETPQSSTLLLLGEAGLGKTLSTYQLADKLMTEWWQYVADPKKEAPYFPIFIRPALLQWSYNELKDGFTKALKSYGLTLSSLDLKKTKILVIVDGYDECEENEKPANLAEQLGIVDLPQVKLLISCRPNTVKSEELVSRFALKGSLITRYFLPFNLTQLLGYLNTGIQWETPVYKNYQVKLQQSPSLRVVLRNPFVASLFVRSWETVQKKDFNQLNRWEIFGCFVEHWLTTHHSLLSPSIQKALTIDSQSKTLLESFNTFAAEIAFSAFQKNAISFAKANKISPLSKMCELWLHLKEQIVQDSQQSFQVRTKELNQKEKRRVLLTEQDYTAIMQWRLQQFEIDSPLKNKDLVCEFSHKNFFEYFVARRIVQLREKNPSAIVKEALELLNYRFIQTEPGVRPFLIEGWQEAKTLTLINPFFEILDLSKEKDFSKRVSSANAATILVIGGISFSGKNLDGACLSGADLSGGVWDGTQAKNSMLNGVNFRNAWLRNTNLSGAQMEKVNWGESTLLETNSSENFALSRDSKSVVITTSKEIKIIDVSSLTIKHKILFKDVELEITKTDDEDSRLALQMLSAIDMDSEDMSEDMSEEMLEKIKYIMTNLKGLSEEKRDNDEPPKVAFSLDNQYLALSGNSGVVQIWDFIKEKCLFTLKGCDKKIIQLYFSFDNKIVAAIAKGGTVYLWDFESREIKYTLQVEIIEESMECDDVSTLAFSPNNRWVALGGADKKISLWDIESGKLIRHFIGHTSAIRCVVFSNDSQFLISGAAYDTFIGFGDDNSLGFWDIETGKLLRTFVGHTSEILSVALSSDGNYCVSGGLDQRVCLWELSTGKLLRTFEGHTGPIGFVSFSNEGKRLISGGRNEGS